MLANLITVPVLLPLLLLVSHYGSSVRAMGHQCIHDSEKVQTLIHGPVVDVKTGLRHGFTPQGIKERTAPQQYKPAPPPDAPEEVHRAFHATAFGNIRIKTSTEDLKDDTKYCKAVAQKVPDFLGGNKKTCTKDDVLTGRRKKIITDKVLPAALKMLSDALKVNQVASKLISKGCEHYTVPETHKTDGVENADFVLYVSAVPTTGDTVAWAGHCSLDEKKRPVTGRINFAPKKLVWHNSNPNAQRQLVRTTVHELLHALGFSSESFTSIFPDGINPISSETRRGKTVKYFNTEKVVEMAKAHFNCQTLKGPEMEDEGGDHVKGSHWKRRNHMDDMMAGIMGGQMYLSPITLGVMEASGHYMIDWTKAENPNWMYKAGCGVIDDKCNTAKGGMGKYFCNDASDMVCSPDHRSTGYCRMDQYDASKHGGTALPDWAKYSFTDADDVGTEPLMDFCPVVERSGNECDNPAHHDLSPLEVSYNAIDGRCFITKALSYADQIPSARHETCLQTKCEENVVYFKMPKFHTKWIKCPSAGAEVQAPNGYKGSIICPDPNLICDAPPPKIGSSQGTGPATTDGVTKPTTSTGSTDGGTDGSTDGTTKSATAISSIIPAVLISSVVFMYLLRLGQ